jgi:putative peptide zinc metalloprotease protein
VNAAKPDAGSESIASAPPSAAASPLVAKLREVVAGLRGDIHFSRHVMRGEVVYIARDPVSFDTHAFSAADYRLLVALNGVRTFGEAFDGLCASGACQAADQEQFFRFILELHRSGLLALPISDDKRLQEKHERRRAARLKSLLMAPLFLRIPVWNPDAFLKRTTDWAMPLFTRWALAVWCVLAGVCGIVLWNRWNDLIGDLPGLLAPEQLLTMWVLLSLLKVVHEFGHGYAVRCFGGAVPEMGISLILLTPCAYVDASASWAFTSRIRRIIVCLGGVYFESWIAAAALLFWAATDAGPARAIAYQAMVLASVTTLGFNLNPLLRFDGYYILSDVLQIPNLRQAATDHCLRFLRKVTLGIDTGGKRWGLIMGSILFVYAIAAAVFRVSIVLSMCALVAIKFFFVGIVGAIAYGGVTLVTTLVKAMGYLCTSEETAKVRVRACAVALLLLAVPAVVVATPFPRSVRVTGIIEAERIEHVNAFEFGSVGVIEAVEGARVEAGDVVLRMDSREARDALRLAEAERHAVAIELELAEMTDPTEGALVRERLEESDRRLMASRARIERLTVRAPIAGEIALADSARETGRVVPPGTSIGTIVAGRRIATLLFDQYAFARWKATGGDTVEVRCRTNPEVLRQGTVISIAAGADRHLASEALAVSGGGGIPVSPLDGRAENGYVEVKVAVRDADAADLRLGARVDGLFVVENESLARRWYGALVWFNEELAAAQ